jgi:hypothetical protein
MFREGNTAVNFSISLILQCDVHRLLQCCPLKWSSSKVIFHIPTAQGKIFLNVNEYSVEPNKYIFKDTKHDYLFHNIF